MIDKNIKHEIFITRGINHLDNIIYGYPVYKILPGCNCYDTKKLFIFDIKTDKFELTRILPDRFTGYYDKDLIEIFENDIIEYKSNIYKVHYDITIGCYVICKKDNHIFRLIDMVDSKDFKVIGNIYFNDNLLDK